MSLLFTPMTIKGVELKNRIVMSPMGTLAAEEDGKVTEWHMLHYGARAMGQVGLIILEATAVLEEGRDYPSNLGLWCDEQIPPMRHLVRILHENGSKAGIQLWHAGRKRVMEGEPRSSSGLPYKGRATKALTPEEVRETVAGFGQAAIRAAKAGFDVLEIHAAHGYLINDFLSPLTNTRGDRYGGSREGRYQFLREIIDEVRSVWSGPLFVRVSANEYSEQGNSIQDYVQFAAWMKQQDVDMVVCSSGGLLLESPRVYPGYQTPYAEMIRREAHIATAAVGLITQGIQAEEILQNGRADLVAIGRELLRDPYWPRTAAKQLGVRIQEPASYEGFWFGT